MTNVSKGKRIVELRLAETPQYDSNGRLDVDSVEVTASATVPLDVNRQLIEVVRDIFTNRFHVYKATNRMGLALANPVGIYLANSAKTQHSLSELEPIALWEDEEEKVNFPPLGVITGQLSLADLERSYRAGYIKRQPQVLYIIRLEGLGSAGVEILEMLSQLFWLGAGWIAADVMPSPQRLLRRHQLTKQARKMADDFERRGIRSDEQIRRWAESREAWTTHEASKKLGLPQDLAESILHALGYKKRDEDQLWWMGETEEYRQRRQAWINGEPTRRRITSQEWENLD